MESQINFIMHPTGKRTGWTALHGCVDNSTLLVFLIGVKPLKEEVAPIWEKLAGYNVVLAGCDCQNWNDELSPWPAESVTSGGPEFGGQGLELGRWLLTRFEPDISRIYNHFWMPATRFIAGYSLAGLFALWQAHSSHAYSAAASCSGSLWYPKWFDFLQHHQPPAGMNVYLSLGDREDAAGPAILRQVGPATQKTYAFYASRKKGGHCIYLKEKGNHFNQTQQRLANGVKWMLDNKKEGTE